MQSFLLQICITFTLHYLVSNYLTPLQKPDKEKTAATHGKPKKTFPSLKMSKPNCCYLQTTWSNNDLFYIWIFKRFNFMTFISDYFTAIQSIFNKVKRWKVELITICFLRTLKYSSLSSLHTCLSPMMMCDIWELLRIRKSKHSYEVHSFLINGIKQR